MRHVYCQLIKSVLVSNKGVEIPKSSCAVMFLCPLSVTWLLNKILLPTGIRAREVCPQCASVPVQWNERDAKAKWRAAKREYPPIPHSLWVWSVLQISIFKKKNVCPVLSVSRSEAACWGAFHSFSFFSRTVDTCSALLSFSFTFTPLLSFSCCLGDPSAAFETGGFC